MDQKIDRRQAVQVMGALPLAGLLALESPKSEPMPRLAIPMKVLQGEPSLGGYTFERRVKLKDSTWKIYSRTETTTEVAILDRETFEVIKITDPTQVLLRVGVNVATGKIKPFPPVIPAGQLVRGVKIETGERVVTRT